MSRAPFVMPKATGLLRANEVMTRPSAGASSTRLMKAQYGIDSMPETAENVAEDFDISREDQDAFALRSQQKAAAGPVPRAVSPKEIVPVEVKGRKGAVTIVDRRTPARHHARVARRPADPVPRWRLRDGRQCDRASTTGRRRSSSPPRRRSRRMGSRRSRGCSAARPRACRRGSWALARRPVEEADGAARARGGGFRRDRAERGLRRAGAGGAARSWRRRRRRRG
jgi:hypothetical protein